MAFLLRANDGKEHVVEDLDGVDVQQTLLGGHETEVDGVRKRPHSP